jgi:hypothetical protein
MIPHISPRATKPTREDHSTPRLSTTASPPRRACATESLMPTPAGSEPGRPTPHASRDGDHERRAAADGAAAAAARRRMLSAPLRLARSGATVQSG